MSRASRNEPPNAVGGRGDRPLGVTKRRLGDPAWLARTAGVGLCVTSLAFVALFGTVLAADGRVGLFTSPPLMRLALSLPPVVAALAVGTAVGSALGWRNGYWSRGIRVHQTVLALLGVAFVWLLTVLGFLP